VQTLSQYLRAAPRELALEEQVGQAIREANRQVLQAARERPDCDGMGSTIVLALWRASKLLIANVGDSHAYLFRGGTPAAAFLPPEFC
jgi:PPM family protein phosphatase